jgi:hypothetical protein
LGDEHEKYPRARTNNVQEFFVTLFVIATRGRRVKPVSTYQVKPEGMLFRDTLWRASTVTPIIPRLARDTFIVARIVVAATPRRLQPGGYMRDTDESRENLQNRVPPMQIGGYPLRSAR